MKDSNDTSDAMLGGANYEIDPDEVIDTNCHYWDRPLGWIAFIVFNFVVMFLVPLFVSLMMLNYLFFRENRKC